MNRLETIVEFEGNVYIVSSSVDGRNRAHTALFECDNCGNVKGEVPIFATLDKDPGHLVENHIATIVNIDNAIIGAPVVTRKPIEPVETSAPETPDPKIEKGNLVACVNLGSCYERGVGVARDLNEAASWYGKAAEQGNENAKKALERVKRLQEEEKRKYNTEAEKLYRRKAEHGDAESQY